MEESYAERIQEFVDSIPTLAEKGFENPKFALFVGILEGISKGARPIQSDFLMKLAVELIADEGIGLDSEFAFEFGKLSPGLFESTSVSPVHERGSGKFVDRHNG